MPFNNFAKLFLQSIYKYSTEININSIVQQRDSRQRNGSVIDYNGLIMKHRNHIL